MPSRSTLALTALSLLLAVSGCQQPTTSPSPTGAPATLASATPAAAPAPDGQPAAPASDPAAALATAPASDPAPTLATAPAPAPASAPVPAGPPAAPQPLANWSPPPRVRTSGCTLAAGLPDPQCSPGAVDPRVTQATIASTICTRGYTATVRPPTSVTTPIKRQEMAAYGVQDQPLSDYELDHLIALELGGAPADVANLWPEPWAGESNAHMKDAVETFLNREVCRGGMPLAEAQRAIATNWLAVYRDHHLQSTP